jgi:hypothetical protein
MGTTYDFGGYATRNNLKCADGRIIMKDAFIDQDGQVVPLVYQHDHNSPENVIGHGLLENREDGVYFYGSFNDTDTGQLCKKLVRHGDLRALSIYANKLKQKAGNVIHGSIREVSLVLSPANPGAIIDYPILEHDDEEPTEAIIYMDEVIDVMHSDMDEDDEEIEALAEEILSHADDDKKEEKPVADNKEKTIGDVFNELTEEQKNVVYYMIGQALNEKGGSDNDDDEGGENVKHNVFDNSGDYLQHGGIDFDAMMKDAKRLGSLKEAYLAHSDELMHADDDNLSNPGTDGLTYGIGNIDYLFPDARTLTDRPEFIKRETDWVQVVMNGTHHTPFSRIKSMFADITDDEARAKGYYQKGKLKKEEVFGLLKRTTTPTTIYKKQKMDRDDVIDITDFDVIAWLKSEMRMMLDEEIARAILIGDGRNNSDDAKINEQNIRPIYKDDPFFAHRVDVVAGADDDITAKNFIRMAVKSRKEYKGSGQPTLFTTEDVLTDMLLLEDDIGHKLYKSEAELATALRVSKIVTVPVMENVTTGGKELMGIIVNLTDYNVGADKGGAVSMFEDFDIDYNQQKYLIETRCSGALIKPKSAIILEKATA